MPMGELSFSFVSDMELGEDHGEADNKEEGSDASVLDTVVQLRLLFLCEKLLVLTFCDVSITKCGVDVVDSGIAFIVHIS